MYKVLIEKSEKHPAMDCDMLSDFISVDAMKPYDLNEAEWNCIKLAVLDLAGECGDPSSQINGPECQFVLARIIDDIDGGILAESQHYFIRRENEEAVLYRKPDSKRITCVGDFYGDPDDAYIDPIERFCITIGCGIIKYNLEEPFEEYMYDTVTPQWNEVGREDEIEWCDRIEMVTDSYIIVSSEGENPRRFRIDTLALAAW